MNETFAHSAVAACGSGATRTISPKARSRPTSCPPSSASDISGRRSLEISSRVGEKCRESFDPGFLPSVFADG